MAPAFSLMTQMKAVRGVKTWCLVLFSITYCLLSAVFYLSKFSSSTFTDSLLRSAMRVSTTKGICSFSSFWDYSS